MVNGIWYTIEGDGVNATISFASTIPLVYLTSAKYIGKIVKLADGSYSVVKFGGKSTKEFLENIQRIDLDADGLKQLNKDLADKEFAEAIVENPKLVDSWKVLDDAGVDDVVRRNIDELELVSKNIDEIKAFDGGYDAWKVINNAGGKVFKTFSRPIAFGGDIVRNTGKKLNILGRANPKRGSIGTKKIYEPPS